MMGEGDIMIYDFDDLNFNILTVEKMNQKEGFYYVKGRPFAALAVRIGGRGDFEIDGKHYVSEDGDVLFVPKNLSYNVKYSKCEIIAIHFAECNYRTFETFSVKNPTYIKDEFEKIAHIWKTKHSINQIKASIYKILQYIADEKTMMVTDHVYKQCVEYIDSNLCDPGLDISSVCRKAGISESGLLRKFRSNTNTTPKKYIIEKRITYAIDLLASGEYSVKKVAEMCGMPDEKYFSRVIKEKYGQPPSAFFKKNLV